MKFKVMAHLYQTVSMLETKKQLEKCPVLLPFFNTLRMATISFPPKDTELSTRVALALFQTLPLCPKQKT